MKYFAYGSNLNIKQMQYRCPDAVKLHPFTLENYQLVFRHYADIIPVAGQSVTGGLWEISEADERYLDRYEGYPTFYEKYYVDDMMFYRMCETGRELVLPSPAYLASLLEGMNDFGLSIADLNNNLGKPYTLIRETEEPLQQAMKMIAAAQEHLEATY